MKKNLSLFLLFVLSFHFFAYSQTTTKKDTTLTTIPKNEIDILDSLLLELWYVKSANNKHTLDSIKKLDHYIDIPDSVIIARLKKIPSAIPLTYNEKVRSWIEFYIKNDHLIPTFLGLGEYYFPIFEDILDKYNLPYELKYLPLIESALNPRARSRAGAVGLWQFLYTTSLLYQLEVNDFVDERMDVVKSTEAAAQYLSKMYQTFNDWLLVIAAYNCGPANVRKAIKRTKKTDFWQIYYNLPRETRSYVPAFIAVTYLMTYAKEHNFYPIEVNIPAHTDTIMIEDTLHLKQVAEVLNIPIELLRDLNPQYKLDIIPGYIKPYPLRLPVEYVGKFIELKDSIFNYKDTAFFKNNQIIVKVAKKYPTTCPQYDLKNKAKIYYTVKQNDNLSLIANWFNVRVKDLKCWNNKTTSRINIGEKLIIYVPKNKLRFYTDLANKSFEEKQKISSNVYAKSKNLDPNYIYHKLQRGETIYDVAKKYNVNYKDILKINNMTEYQAKRLREGQLIKIKRK